jgi:NAD(P)H-hydrate epimerase
MLDPREQIESVVVNATQMQTIEKLIFEAGMPVAALMEKAAILTANFMQSLYPLSQFGQVGILVGPGHNGGDALVIARELYLNGYNVLIYRPISKLKELTTQHAQYALNLGIEFYPEVESLKNCDLIVDGLFGLGLQRKIAGPLAEYIQQLNQWGKPVVSIDIPSGIHTDTGEVLGIAVRASHTCCLGLWKQAFFQDSALAYLGKVERIDFGIPPQYVWQVLGQPPPIQTIAPKMAKKCLPIPRPLTTHKYQQGHLLLICGSSRYAGGAILAGSGARSSGVGMLSMAVPKSLKLLLVSHIPEALIIECPETEQGAIASLPCLDFNKYNAIACGCGLTTEATSVVETVLKTNLPLILDADGLNILAAMNNLEILRSRPAQTILTPHLGEFKRLFPSFKETEPQNRFQITQKAALVSNAIVLLKGAKTMITSPQGKTWLIAESTPALAKGGSGDVLTGLMGGLVSQVKTIGKPLEDIVATAAWLHQQAGILACQDRSELGVDGVTLAEYVFRVISNQ